MAQNRVAAHPAAPSVREDQPVQVQLKSNSESRRFVHDSAVVASAAVVDLASEAVVAVQPEEDAPVAVAVAPQVAVVAAVAVDRHS